MTTETSEISQKKSGSNVIPTTDRNSPYFICTSDNPSTFITPILFDGQNFIVWSVVLENILQGKVKMGILYGSLARLDDPTTATT